MRRKIILLIGRWTVMAKKFSAVKFSVFPIQPFFQPFDQLTFQVTISNFPFQPFDLFAYQRIISNFRQSSYLYLSAVRPTHLLGNCRELSSTFLPSNNYLEFSFLLINYRSFLNQAQFPEGGLFSIRTFLYYRFLYSCS